MDEQNEQDESKEMGLIGILFSKIDATDSVLSNVGNEFMRAYNKIDRLEKRIKILEEKK